MVTKEDRYRKQAEDKDRYDQMRTLLQDFDDKPTMNQAAMLFFFPDLSYPRADICLVMKSIEMEKGWRG